MSENLSAYDTVFVESIVEEINEILLERYKDDDTVPLLGVVEKDRLPGGHAIWLHVFKTEDLRERIGKE